MEQRFLFQANAVALGGSITRPYQEVIETQASSCLPITGGTGRARVENFRHRDLVSFTSAHSSVTGDERKEGGRAVRRTLTTVTVEGLNVSNVVTADAVVARLVSDQTGSQSSMSLLPIGSYFVNLRIAGVPVQTSARDVLCRTGRPSLLRDASKQKAGDVPGHLSVFSEWKDPGLGEESSSAEYTEQRVLTYLFDLGDLPPGCELRKDGGISVPGFGAVFVGEFFVTQFSRQLTMLRIEMGSPVGGTLLAAHVGGNGSTHP